MLMYVCVCACFFFVVVLIDLAVLHISSSLAVQQTHEKKLLRYVQHEIKAKSPFWARRRLKNTKQRHYNCFRKYKKNGNNQRRNVFFFPVFLSSVLKVKTKKLMVLWVETEDYKRREKNICSLMISSSNDVFCGSVTDRKARRFFLKRLSDRSFRLSLFQR